MNSKNSTGIRYVSLGITLGLISGAIFGNIPLALLLGLAFSYFLKYQNSKRRKEKKRK